MTHSDPHSTAVSLSRPALVSTGPAGTDRRAPRLPAGQGQLTSPLARRQHRPARPPSGHARHTTPLPDGEKGWGGCRKLAAPGWPSSGASGAAAGLINSAWSRGTVRRWLSAVRPPQDRWTLPSAPSHRASPTRSMARETRSLVTGQPETGYLLRLHSSNEIPSLTGIMAKSTEAASREGGGG